MLKYFLNKLVLGPISKKVLYIKHNHKGVVLYRTLSYQVISTLNKSPSIFILNSPFCNLVRLLAIDRP